jgi:methyl-accepting chemotaxis protein
MRLKDMTFGQRIGTGFGIMLVLITAIGVMSFTGVSGIVSNADVVIHGNELERMIAQKEVDHLAWANKVNKLLTDDTVTTLDVETDDHKCGFGEWLYGEERTAAETLVPSLAPLLKEIEEPHLKLHGSAVSIKEVYKQANASLPAFLAEKEVDHLKWASEIRDALLKKKTKLAVQTDATKCAFGKWLETEAATTAYEQGSEEFKRSWSEMLENHEKLHASAKEIQKSIKESDDAAIEIFSGKTSPLLDATLTLIEKLRTEAEANLEGQTMAAKIYAEETTPALESTRELLSEIVEEAQKHIMTDAIMLNKANGTKRRVTFMGLAACAVGVMLAFFISRGLTTVLKNASAQLDETSDQVASASSQVSGGSQALAEGTSEQAASIEETSSSMEEMSAMIRQNAENAAQANRLMGDSGKVMDQAEQSMQRLAGSMEEISQAGLETSKIIKTIDEIAFQTNLLALNAAVEAARAGEAGAGFAVVADEVRSLALRAAEAARNTANLIEGTLVRVKEGVALGNSTKDDFVRVSESMGRVSELVNEIASASSEQSQGIEQIGRAVSEVEKVVQQNAANAEESASAAEEMSAQAEQMKYVVSNLMVLAGVKNKEERTLRKKVIEKTGQGNAGSKQNFHGVTEKGREKAILSEKKEISPEQVIPFGEGDFEDF